jgi:glycosyltransferase involved in cell wall biosynthesis
MRIVIVSGFAESTYGGGASRITFDLLKNLKQFSLRNRLDNEFLLIQPTFELEYSRSGERIYIPGTHSKDGSIPNLENSIINKLFEDLKTFQPDIIHTHTSAGIASIVQYWANKNNVSFIFTSHVVPSKTLFFQPNKKNILSEYIQDNYINNYLKIFLGNCTGLVALNKVIEADFRKFTNEVPIYLIPNGTDFGEGVSRKQSDKNENIKVITFTGSICERKNQKYLIDAMSFLPEYFKLNLIGPVTNKLYSQKNVKPFLTNRIKYLGELSKEEVINEILNTDIVVSASLIEVQSLIILEALALGKPIVALRNETTGELIDDNVGKLVETSESPEVFALKVMQVSRYDSNKLERISIYGRELSQRFKWDSVISKTLKMYEDQISKKARNRDSKLKKSFPLLILLSLTSFITFIAYKVFRIKKAMSKED